MLIFIDDSGDPGVKFDNGSSKHFCLCAIKFSDTLEVERSAVEIKEWKRKVKVPDSRELKFNKLSQENRVSIIKALSKYDFDIYALTHIKTSSDFISYEKYINLFLRNFEKEFTDIKIFIDGSGEAKNINTFKSNISRNTNISTKNIRVSDSKDNILIQMADIFVGAINKDLNKDQSHELYLKSFKIKNFKI